MKKRKICAFFCEWSQICFMFRCLFFSVLVCGGYCQRLQIDLSIDDGYFLNMTNMPSFYEVMDWVDNGNVYPFPCPEQTYSEDTSGVCKPCRVCLPGTFVRQSCRPWRNTVCVQCQTCNPDDIVRCECNQINTDQCLTGNRLCIPTVPVTLTIALPFKTQYQLSATEFSWCEVRLQTRMIDWLKSTFKHPQIQYVSMIQIQPIIYVANYVLVDVKNNTLVKTFLNRNPDLFYSGFVYAFDETVRRRNLFGIQYFSKTAIITESLASLPLSDPIALNQLFEKSARDWLTANPSILDMNVISAPEALLGDKVDSIIVGCYNNASCPPYYQNLCNECVPSPCPPGTSASGIYFQCELCPNNTYKNFTGDAECTACPATSFSQVGSVRLSDCIFCPPGFTRNNTSSFACVPCAINTYKDIRGDSLCSVCPNNGISAIGSNSLLNCSSCPVGQTPNASVGTCVLCPENMYKAVIGNVPCVNCTNGSYSFAGSTSSSDCKFCPVGQTPVNKTCQKCPSNTFKPNLFGFCTQCPTGNSPSGSISQDNCTVCLPGRFWNVSSESCSPCPANFFKDNPGNVFSMCKPCSTGSISLPGSTSEMDCSVCAKGFVFDNITLRCQPCLEGFYKDTTDVVPCTKCPWNRLSLKGSVNVSNCTLCPTGFENGRLDLTHTVSCQSCKPFFFKDNTLELNCSKCPIFFQNAYVSQAKNCSFVCPKDNGLYWINLGYLRKVLLTEFLLDNQWTDTMRSSKNTSILLKYLAVNFQNNISLPVNPICQNCPLGSFSVFDSATNVSYCQDCPLHFRYDSGARQCISCGKGYQGNFFVGGSSQCQPCPLNFFKSESVGECLPCAIGSHAPSVGMSVCVLMSKKRYYIKVGFVYEGQLDTLQCQIAFGKILGFQDTDLYRISVALENVRVVTEVVPRYSQTVTVEISFDNFPDFKLAREKNLIYLDRVNDFFINRGLFPIFSINYVKYFNETGEEILFEDGTQSSSFSNTIVFAIVGVSVGVGVLLLWYCYNSYQADNFQNSQSSLFQAPPKKFLAIRINTVKTRIY